jgi:protein-S-isoprenylcysteine O-methyltransferase Ste14
MAAGLVPYLLLPRVGARPKLPPLAVLPTALGGALVVAGLGMLVWTVSLFIRIGLGTLAPWDPTRRLVLVGPFAYVRNPMITGVFAVISGEAVLFRSWRIATWALAFLVINHLYFLLSEEPGLVKRFGSEYDAYRRNVPRWLPRATPWVRRNDVH